MGRVGDADRRHRRAGQRFEALKAHFSDTEIADLTFAISIMNAFNRLAVSMRQ